jgi:hypothetical protein
VHFHAKKGVFSLDTWYTTGMYDFSAANNELESVRDLVQGTPGNY